MKYNEFHRFIRQNGWKPVRQKGTSHVIYEKDGRRYPVPDHGAKEFPEPLRLKIVKDMGL
jgi:predicted RNA binding protein YcfA (HicA-like mRNA interferase family)